MGKVDQGVFTHWVLAPLLRAASCATSATAAGQAGARPAPRRRPGRPRRASSSPTPTRWAGVTVNVGGGRESACRCSRPPSSAASSPGNEVAVAPRRTRAPRRRADLPLRLRAALRRTDWRPRGPARRPRGHLRVDRGQRGAPSRRPRVAYLSAMPTAIVTGSGGLIGSESGRALRRAGFDVVGLENDMRARFFGPRRRPRGDRGAARALPRRVRARSTSTSATRRRRARLRRARPEIELVVHAAAQPSHDWAASDPQTDFAVNANGTLNLLEAARRHAPDATFIFLLDEQGLRRHAQPPAARRARDAARAAGDHRWHGGIDTSMSIDPSMHSLFGVSKAAADLMVQEYGRYFGMPTVCFRGGCLTGPQPRRREAARLPVLPDALHDDRRAVHRLRLRRQAGARQHPQRRPRRAPSTPSTRAPRPPPSTTSAAAAQQLLDARGDRAVRADRRPRARLDAPTRPRIGDHRWWISDLPSSAPTTPTGRSSYDVEDDPARDPRPERGAVDGGPREALGRHPGPQRGGSIAQTVRSIATQRSTPRDRLRDHRRRRRLARTAPPRSSRRVAEATNACACAARTTRAASASPCARASTRFEGTRWRS